MPESPRKRGRPETLLTIVFVAIVFAVPLLQLAVELRRGQGIGALDVFRQRPTTANLRAYEHGLEDASVVARALRPLFQFAQFTWLRDGGEKALVGRDGWLFYKPGYDDMVTRGKPLLPTNDPVTAIVAFRDALAARGIQLLVVPAPNKESIYPDRLSTRVPEGQVLIAPPTRELFARLHAAKVECVDLFAVFAAARTDVAASNAAPLYLKQDSHWSPAGVALAARAVAQRLTDLGWAKPGTLAYRERATPVKRLGDVVHMLRSQPIERALVPESVPCVQVVREDGSQIYQDQTDSEVLVLGDSFLRIYQQDEPGAAGFIAHLARELKQPLGSVVNDGGASTLVRQELHRRASLLQNKHVVVWQFVERDIRLGTEGWQHVPLPSAKDHSPAPSSQHHP